MHALRMHAYGIGISNPRSSMTNCNVACECMPMALA